MLSEETLILYAAAGACILLVLGILELIAPTRPRHPRRARAGTLRDPRRRGRAGPPPVVRSDESPPWPSAAGRASAPVEPEPPIERILLSEAASIAQPMEERGVTSSRASSLAHLSGSAPAPKAPAVAEPAAPAGPAHAGVPLAPVGAVPATDETVVTPVVTPADAGPATLDPFRAVAVPAAATPSAEPEPSPMAARCCALYERREFHEVIAEAVPMLESAANGALFLEARDVATLWGVVGLSRQELGDNDGARVAFEEAIAAAPEWDRATWQRHLAALALNVGQQLLAQAKSATGAGEETVTALHAAIRWLEGGLTAASEDHALKETAIEARAALWPTYERVATDLIQHQEHQLARQLLRQALTDSDCPADMQASLRELFATTHSGEVGQLTAEAIRRMQEGKEEEALATLDRAEGLLTAIPDDGLTVKRRQELERRLWWSFTKVGMRRLDSGKHEEALDPLLRAMRFVTVGPERLDESKRSLGRALEGIVEARSPLILRLAAEGDRDAALVLCEELHTFLRSAMACGLTRDEVAVPVSRIETLFAKLGKPRK